MARCPPERPCAESIHHAARRTSSAVKPRRWSSSFPSSCQATARCGPSAEDETTDVFPVVKRTMRYKASGQRTIVFTFTRSADEPQNWVLLTIKDSVGDTSYETPDAKISALPCLDSTK